jgi:hypothetical protein
MIDLTVACVVWLKLNETTSVYIAQDSSGNNYDGTMYAGFPAHWFADDATIASGVAQCTPGFDYESGNEEFIRIPNKAEFDGLSACSVCAWMRADSDADAPIVTFWYSNTDRLVFRREATGDKPRLWNDINDVGQAISGNVDSWEINTWYFIVFTIDTDGSVKIYMNASEVGSSTLSSGNRLTDLTDGWAMHIGRITNVTPSYLNGKMDNFMVFDRVLTQPEITWLYNSGDGREQLREISPLLVASKLIGSRLA